MYIILLGAPGSGKGTQAQMISSKTGMYKIVTSDLLRSEISKGSKMGLKIKGIMDAGMLVSDDIINGLIEKKIFSPEVIERGAIFDGYPRTEAQAEFLSSILLRLGAQTVYAVNLDISEEKLLERFDGRFNCASCGTSYHKTLKPTKIENECDVCHGHEFIVRVDDNHDTVRKRLAIYNDKTRPLISYYKERETLYSVDASQSVDKVLGAVMSIIRAEDLAVSAASV